MGFWTAMKTCWMRDSREKGGGMRDQNLPPPPSLVPVIAMHLREKSVGFNGGGKRSLNVIPNLCNRGKLIPFAFRGENMSFMIRN